jgi:hypothetical protein
MRDVIANVASEDADENTHHIVEALKILEAWLVFREGVEEFQ